jgi:hypothetical protein
VADDPVACNVSLTDPAYVTTHPWWDTLVFRDINRAIERCALPTRRVRVLPNDPPQDYILTIDPQFAGNESNCNYTAGKTQVVFADTTDASNNPVVIRGCRHQLAACDVTFENFIFVHDCSTTTDPTWNTNVTDPAPLPLPRLGLVNNTFYGQSTSAPAIAPLADDRLMIGDHSTGDGKEIFYLAFQQGFALAPTRGNLFTNYNGPSIVNVTGRSCDVNISAQFNIWDRSPGNAFWTAGIGGINFDYNNFVNSGGLIAGPESLVYVNACIPSANSTGKKFELMARYNQIITDVTYNPAFINLTAGGFFAGFWFDPVPYDIMDVSIRYNRGNVSGICMRQDHRPDHSSLLDPQAEARLISLSENNFFCEGSVHDVRFLNGPAFDPTVDTDLVLYRKYYCDGMFFLGASKVAPTLIYPCRWMPQGGRGAAVDHSGDSLWTARHYRLCSGFLSLYQRAPVDVLLGYPWPVDSRESTAVGDLQRHTGRRGQRLYRIPKKGPPVEAQAIRLHPWILVSQEIFR